MMAAPRKADLVLINGRIFSGLGHGRSEAVAVRGDRVIALGSVGDVEALIGRSTKVIDLSGRLATAGFCDAHLHLLPLGLTMGELDARPSAAPTLAALLAVIRRRAVATQPGDWILARGYDQAQLDVRRHPRREELDAAAPDHPVCLVRSCGHVAVANSLALRLAGIDESTPVPPGGLIERRDGRLTGLLAESGRDPIRAVLPDATDEDLIAAIERAGRHCLAFGITAVMDAAVGKRAGYREIAAYRQARQAGRLPVRTTMCLVGGSRGVADAAYGNGLVTGSGDEMLAVGPVKLFADGSAGARTAAMTTPYAGEPATRGVLHMSDEEMRALARDYHRKGYQLAVHAIGDAAIEQTLQAYEAALAEMPDPARRHRIEHCAFARPDQTARMVRLGIEPVPQPVFIHDYGEAYIRALGEERAARCFPMRRWLNHGLRAAASSDAPVSDPNPFRGLYAMLTRNTAQGVRLGGSEAISAAEAIAAYTAFGAYVNRTDRRRGRLVPGSAADLAVFSRDLTTAHPEDILHDTRCELTILGGKIVYDAMGATADLRTAALRGSRAGAAAPQVPAAAARVRRGEERAPASRRNPVRARPSRRPPAAG
jgi:predicted amidohydrolase YtcJ